MDFSEMIQTLWLVVIAAGIWLPYFVGGDDYE